MIAQPPNYRVPTVGLQVDRLARSVLVSGGLGKAPVQARYGVSRTSTRHPMHHPALARLQPAVQHACLTGRPGGQLPRERSAQAVATPRPTTHGNIAPDRHSDAVADTFGPGRLLSRRMMKRGQLTTKWPNRSTAVVERRGRRMVSRCGRRRAKHRRKDHQGASRTAEPKSAARSWEQMTRGDKWQWPGRRPLNSVVYGSQRCR